MQQRITLKNGSVCEARHRHCSLRPFAAYEQKDLLLNMERLSKADWSEDIEKSRVDILVSSAFVNVLPCEQPLLGVEEEGISDFESSSDKKDVEEEVAGEAEDSIENHILRFVASKIGKINDKRWKKWKKKGKEEKKKEMYKGFIKERKSIGVEIDLKVKQCVDELRQFINQEITELRRHFDERFDALAPTSGAPTSCNEVIIHTPTSTHSSPPAVSLKSQQTLNKRSLIKAIKERPDRKRRVEFSPTQDAFQFLGRASISSKKQAMINHIMKTYTASNDIIFRHENLQMFRSDLDALLWTGWLSDLHLDAYSVALSMQNTKFPERFKSFLYISPTHTLKFVLEDIGESLPARVHEWPIIPVEGIPAQEGGDDCGVFVLMFMKTIVSRKKCSWRKRWQRKMSLFRAEIAVEMLQSFCQRRWMHEIHLRIRMRPGFSGMNRGCTTSPEDARRCNSYSPEDKAEPRTAPGIPGEGFSNDTRNYDGS
ncbi:hypothetical protein KSP39_PZI021809 [Platanthera zijinensis]|uniref:Ubiquitin-like protease family profile domain-containing protein n=1 Tax=Platanthera zijinensis TaxID=2320716 RepID=A0AAP0AXL5_9ASPA